MQHSTTPAVLIPTRTESGSASRPSGDRPAATAVRMAVHQVTTCRWSFDEDVVGLRETGFDAVGIWRPKLAEYGEERAALRLQDAGLSVSSLSWAGGFTGSHGMSWDQAVEDVRDAVRSAVAVGAPCVVLASGTRRGHTRRHARRVVADGLKEIADFAASRGVALALQPLDPVHARTWSFLHGLDETLEVLDAVRHPAARLAFDAFALGREPGILRRVAEIASRTAVVKLADRIDPLRSERDHRVPGEGELPLVELVGAFQRAGYAGQFEIELWSDAVWTAPDYAHVLRSARNAFTPVAGSVPQPMPQPVPSA